MTLLYSPSARPAPAFRGQVMRFTRVPFARGTRIAYAHLRLEPMFTTGEVEAFPEQPA